MSRGLNSGVEDRKSEWLDLDIQYGNSLLDSLDIPAGYKAIHANLPLWYKRKFNRYKA